MIKSEQKEQREKKHLKKLMNLIEAEKCYYYSENYDNGSVTTLIKAWKKLTTNDKDTIPDFFLGEQKEYGLEEFEVSSYDIEIKKKIQSPKHILKRDIEKHMDQIKDPETGIFSFNDTDIDPYLKKGEYRQRLNNFNESLYKNINHHGKSYMKSSNDIKRGFLIYTEVPFEALEFNFGTIKRENYCIFKDQSVLKLFNLYNIEFAFQVIGEIAYFYHKSMDAYDEYSKDIEVLFLNQCNGIKKTILE